jgi:hypothetical protein
MAEAAEGDRRLRLEDGGKLLAAARRCGARPYVQQASGFFLRPGPGLGDEAEGLAVGAPSPPRVTVEQAPAAAGEDAVYYGTKLRGRRTPRRSGCSAIDPAGWSG